jgi:hypothetical protein
MIAHRNTDVAVVLHGTDEHGSPLNATWGPHQMAKAAVIDIGITMWPIPDLRADTCGNF